MNLISKQFSSTSGDVERLAIQLKKSRSQERILDAKLKNQLVRYEKLSLKFEQSQKQIDLKTQAHQSEILELKAQHERESERQIRQKELLLEQLSTLENEYAELAESCS